MTNSQALEVLTKIFKDVDNLTTYNVDVNRVYILDYIKSHIDSIFRMLKVEKLEFITNKNKPIVIKNDGLIVGVVCPIVMR